MVWELIISHLQLSPLPYTVWPISKKLISISSLNCFTILLLSIQNNPLPCIQALFYCTIFSKWPLQLLRKGPMMKLEIMFLKEILSANPDGAVVAVPWQTGMADSAELMFLYHLAFPTLLKLHPTSQYPSRTKSPPLIRAADPQISAFSKNQPRLFSSRTPLSLKRLRGELRKGKTSQCF